MATPRFPATVDEEGRILPVHRERVRRHQGKTVWVSVHERPVHQRGNSANAYLWGVVYATLAAETGNDPETIHYGLKTWAVRIGVLEPQYALMGDQLIVAEPTTVVEDEQFWRYVNWIRELAEHGKLTGSPLHIPEPGE